MRGMKRGKHWRGLLWPVLLVCLLALGAYRPARAAEPRLDEPGTYLIEVGSGRTIHLGHGALVAWAPDSQGITAITLEEGGGSIVTFDARSGEVRETVPDAKDPSCQRGLAWSPDGTYLAYGGPGLREGCGDVGNWGVWIWQPATHTAK